MNPPAFQAQLYHGRPRMADFTNTSNAIISAGTVIVDGGTLRITHCDILVGQLAAAAMEGGTYLVAKAFDGLQANGGQAGGTTTAIADGVDVYWDATNKVITANSNSGANLKFGVTEAASSDTDTVQKVLHKSN